MASERQIAANRRNARNSTGPRSSSGKTRASQNAYRHGLTLQISGPEFEGQVEILARQIAGDMLDEATLRLARVAAEAELELGRVRGVKAALIERAVALGGLEPAKHFRSRNHQARWLLATLGWIHGERRIRPPDPIAEELESTMPSQEPDRSAEAVRRILPELLKLHRYEARAVARRDQAIRSIAMKGEAADTN
jgi:hypothetical protein